MIFFIKRKPTTSKLWVFTENKGCSQLVVLVGVFKVILKSRYTLELNNGFYILNLSINLISISRLIIKCYSFLFENTMIFLEQNFY